MIRPEILKRITYAKFLLLQGHEILQSSTPIADGVSVSLYQDAAEMLLRSVAEYFDADIKPRTSFDEIFNKIENASNNKNKVKISSKIAITQLNKSRVNFKHHGLLPTHDDSKKFSHDIEVFFQRTVEDCFGLNYEDISLAGVVKNDRIRNFLNLTEKCFYDANFSEAVMNSTKAFRLILQKTTFAEIGEKFYTFRDFDNRELSKVLLDIEESITEHEKQLNILKYGINLADYTHFQNITPAVSLSAARTFHIEYLTKINDDELEDNAQFCLNFVILSAIKVEQKEYIKRKWYEEKYNREFIVTKPAEIIVYPIDSQNQEQHEVIKTVSKEDVLVGNFSRFDKGNYVSIIHDDDPAYILKASVKAR